MSIAGLLHLLAVYAFGGAHARDRAIVGSSRALEVVILGTVAAGTDGANRRPLLDVAVPDRVVQCVASVTPAYYWEGDVFFDVGETTEEGRWVLDHGLELRTVSIKEGHGNG